MWDTTVPLLLWMCDGDMDLVIGRMEGDLSLYENTGKVSTPHGRKDALPCLTGSPKGNLECPRCGCTMMGIWIL